MTYPETFASVVYMTFLTYLSLLYCVSLPLALPRSLGSSSAATIGYRTSSSRPINATPSPPCYWVEQNKNKQSERGQRRSEAAAEAEEWGRGPADQRPGRAVAARGGQYGGRGSHARAGGVLLPVALGRRRLPHVGRGRGRGGLAAAVGTVGPGPHPPRSPRVTLVRPTPGAAGSCGCSLSEARPARPGRCSAGPPPPPQPLPRRPGVRALAAQRSPRAPGRTQLNAGDGTVGEVCRPDGDPVRGPRPESGPGRVGWPYPLREGRGPAGKAPVGAGTGRGQLPALTCANSSLLSPAQGPLKK